MVKGLSVSGMYSYDYIANNDDEYRKAYNLYDTSGNAIGKVHKRQLLIRFPVISILNRIIYGRRASAMTIILASTMWEH